MDKSEFIFWLVNESSYERRYKDSNDDWKELIDYGEYIYDYLELYETTVRFSYEKIGWGTTETITTEYEFENFIKKYNNYELKQ